MRSWFGSFGAPSSFFSVQFGFANPNRGLGRCDTVSSSLRFEYSQQSISAPEPSAALRPLDLVGSLGDERLSWGRRPFGPPTPATPGPGRPECLTHQRVGGRGRSRVQPAEPPAAPAPARLPRDSPGFHVTDSKNLNSEISCRTPPDSGPGCLGSLPRRGRNTSAQGNALGPRGIPSTSSPEGATQDSGRRRSCFALSGQGSGFTTCSVPGALPRADVLRPLRGEFGGDPRGVS